MSQEMMGFWDAVASAGPHANNQCYSTEGKTEGILHFLLPVTSVLPMVGHMKISDFGLSHILCCSFFFAKFCEASLCLPGSNFIDCF